MKKTILNLKGAVELTKSEQKSIFAGTGNNHEFTDSDNAVINPCTGIVCSSGKRCLIDPISNTGFCV